MKNQFDDGEIQVYIVFVFVVVLVFLKCLKKGVQMSIHINLQQKSEKGMKVRVILLLFD